MQNRFVLLVTDVMPTFTIIALDIVITLRFSINCTTVICSPTVIISITYGPGSIFHHISFRSTIVVSYLLYFSIFYFANNREGIDNPFVALVASWRLFVQVLGG